MDQDNFPHDLGRSSVQVDYSSPAFPSIFLQIPNQTMITLYRLFYFMRFTQYSIIRQPPFCTKQHTRLFFSELVVVLLNPDGKKMFNIEVVVKSYLQLLQLR